MKKVALFGGTFDPVHNGHLKVAETVVNKCNYDELWFVPSAVSPHKDENMFSFSDRIYMIQLAINYKQGFKIWDKDIRQNDKSYTIFLVRELINQFKDYEFSFVIGADNVLKLKTWKDYQELLKMITFIVVNRNTDNKECLENLEYYSKLRFVFMPEYNISSSELRKMINNHQNISGLVSPAVESFIKTKIISKIDKE